MTTKLPVYKITYEGGESYVTSMAAGITLEDARAYFVGKSFEQADGTMKRVQSVEATDKPSCLLVRTELDIALDKMRKNIVPDLSVSVIAERFDGMARRLQQTQAELERIRNQREVCCEALKDVRNAYQQMFDVMPVAFQTYDAICENALAECGVQTKPEPTGNPDDFTPGLVAFEGVSAGCVSDEAWSQ